MTVYFDSTISGDGVSALSSGQDVYLALSHVVTLGNDLRHVDPDNSDRLLRFGWFSLGDIIDIGDGSTYFWRPVVWFDFADQLWTPVASTVAGTPLTVLATQLRWHINDGGSVHLWVAGV